MKKIILCCTAAGLVLLGACNSNNANSNGSDSVVAELNDSLLVANAEKDSLLSIINEINNDMMQIRDMEKLMSSSNLGNETANRKQEIKDNMLLIQQALKDRRERLAALEKRLRTSSGNNAQLQKTIDGLKAQLDEQEATIAQLTEQLKKAHIEIQTLNTAVDSLTVENKAVTEAKDAAQEKSEMLANELNTCYYVVGSKDELKDNKIIETGFLRKTKVLEGDYELSYFTKADKRTLEELPLHSKKAKILTKHPADSYELLDVDGVKTLKITNSAKFWELSNYLVIQID